MSCPVHLWYGALDVNAPPRNGTRYAARIPHAELTVFDETAHLGTLLDNWDAILAATADG